eukprot:TRINITY_DN31717_c0_g1_i1.p1 TRINITY_DN31717_c0_g1~~TRINITY_DN31717_c0_g1_i1.p1  ORF type:complete len:106 (-),score=25.15 TRINITY_DN31717_c0_g1_i1:3-320(-)
MHKMVLFSGLRALRNMLCKHCVDTHENIVIVAPDATKQEVQAAVDEFYDSGKGESLANLFGIMNKDYAEYIQTKIQLDEDEDSDQNTNTNDNEEHEPREFITKRR